MKQVYQIVNQNISNQFLTPQDLRNKTIAISSKPNDPETEQDFRETCLMYENQYSVFGQSLSQEYQEYIDAYHHNTSLHFISKDEFRTKLIIYNTENETETVKMLNTPETLCPGTCITKLPNGGLFVYGSSQFSGITLIIDKNYGFRVLPSGTPCLALSGIYFNKSVYCFGGYNRTNVLSLSKKFDLKENRWIRLVPLPEIDFYCHCVKFKENVLISGFYSKNIWLYSFDISSFSEISYEFAETKRKILINAVRLYLIECGDEGLIYESEDVFTWKQISKSIIGISCPSKVDCLYNKWGIYISTNLEKRYYKFYLNQRVMVEFNKKE